MIFIVRVNQIYHMDCLELLQGLPDACVRLILTDPPYGIDYQNGYAYEKSPRLEGDTGIEYEEFARQSYRVLDNNAHAYFFTRFDRYPYHYQCLTAAGFRVKNCLAIEKGQIGGIGDIHGSYAANCEWIIFCHKGRRAFSETRLLKNAGPVGKKASCLGNPIREYKTRFNCCWFGPDYPKANYNSSWKVKHGNPHPTPKNVELLEWLILISSDPGDLVFDGFMGIGSTALAARNTGRAFLGSEISAAYCQISGQRLRGEVAY